MPLYCITTWDSELQQFTEQNGLENPSQDILLSGIRPVLKELKAIGYESYRFRTASGEHVSDSSVLVERTF